MTKQLAKEKTMRQNNPNKIIIHHTADVSLNTQFNSVDSDHKRRWNFVSKLGYYCGYHYFIERDGEVIQARLDTDEGAHTIGQNIESIGIALAGNFNLQLPTAKQRNALVVLIDKLCEKWNISPKRIYPHRAFQNKDCYGTNLSDVWAKDTYLDFKNGTTVNMLWLCRAGIESLLKRYGK